MLLMFPWGVDFHIHLDAGALFPKRRGMDIECRVIGETHVARGKSRSP